MTPIPFTRRLAAIAACVACLCAAFAAPAGADETSEYPADAAARDFTSSAGNWTSTNTFDGSCIAPILCPTVVNSFVPAGGADGNGYITSAFTGVVGVDAIAGTSTSVWESPAFVYSGARGAGPTSVALDMNRRASVDQLLAVSGNEATFSVQLSDVSAGGAGPTVIGPSTLAGADTWSAASGAVEPAQLNDGDNYRIKITSRYKTGTSVLVTGTADYDNVVLRAVRSGNGAGNGGGNGDGNGNGAGGSGNQLTSASLLSQFSSGMSGTAVLKGNRLFVKVKCPKKIGRACRITAQGLLRKHRPATTKRTVKVRSGKGKQVVLKVKPKLRAKVAKRRRLLVSERIRVGKTSATAYKVRKLIRR